MKKFRLLNLFALLILTTSITGCEDDPQVEIKENYTLLVSPTSHSFPSQGGELSIAISAIKTTTTISEDLIVSDKEDVSYSVNINGAGFIFLEDENVIVTDKNEGDDRSGILTVSIDGTDLKREVKLFQLGGFKEPGVIRYVAPVSQGKGNGGAIDDAADFMDDQFWQIIGILLTNEPVEVNFLPGDYSKAYIENGLILSNIGDKTNRLTLTGLDSVIFKLPLGHADRSDILRFNNCQNIHIRNFHFKGDGRAQYSLRITGANSTNFLIENCSWMDMYGIIFGATGAHQGASNITYRNCIFKRIGFSGGSHMMYHSYGASNIGVINCHFEDCMGDYVRFRARTDYCVVKESTFVRTEGYPDIPFIAIPCFNDVDPGDEWFGTNFAFFSNKFENRASSDINDPIRFYHNGYSPKQFRYLLTKSEGELLENGTSNQKKEILLYNFGIEADKIRIANNDYSGKILQRVTIGSYASYGAISLGWTGSAIITDLLNNSDEPFEWEF